MRLPVVTFAGLLVLALGAAPARAQEPSGFGLDLSGETPPSPEKTPSPGKAPGRRKTPGPRKAPAEAPADAPTSDVMGGFELGAALPSSALLPRLVLVGLDTADKTGAAAANRWLTALTRAARDTRKVELETGFQLARKRLAGNYAATVRCAEAACLAEPADALDADLLVTGRLAREGKVWTLRLSTYDKDRNAVAEDVLTGKSPRDAKFLSAASQALASRVSGLARPRAMLKVSVNVPQAVVVAGEKTLGVGSTEARLPPGEVKLSVEADGFATFSKAVTLAPGETVVVAARLELNGPMPEGPSVRDEARAEPRDEAEAEAALAPVSVAKKGPSGPSLFKRPALYTAVVGLAAVGVGVALGMQAQSVGDRARDVNGDGVLDVTRREFQDAESQATLATLLMAGGGAVAGGSVLWMVLVPTKSAPPPSPVAGASQGASTGVHLFAGGSF